MSAAPKQPDTIGVSNPATTITNPNSHPGVDTMITIVSVLFLIGAVTTVAQAAHRHIDGDWGVLLVGATFSLFLTTVGLGGYRHWLKVSADRIRYVTIDSTTELREMRAENNEREQRQTAQWDRIEAGLLRRVDALEDWVVGAESRLKNFGTRLAAVAEAVPRHAEEAVTGIVERRDAVFEQKFTKVRTDYEHVKQHIEAVETAVPGLAKAAAKQEVTGLRQQYTDLDKTVAVVNEKVGPGFAVLRKEGWAALKQHARAIHKRVGAQNKTIEDRDKANGQRFEAIEGRMTGVEERVADGSASQRAADGIVTPMPDSKAFELGRQVERRRWERRVEDS